VNNAVQAVRRGRDPASRVPSAQARRHIEELLADGWSKRRIAERAGVAERTLYRVLDSPHCSRITERLVLAVTP